MAGTGIEVFEAEPENSDSRGTVAVHADYTLSHVRIFHLAFNLYWFWTFEHARGKSLWATFARRGFFLLLAFGSMLAEFALFRGGVGLSGVGYGLWGMLWVLERRDPRFADAVDANTSRTFCSGGFFCASFLRVTRNNAGGEHGARQSEL